MAVRTIWCQACDYGYPVVAGLVPSACPHCDQQPARWTSRQPVRAKLPLDEDFDRQWLRLMRIKAPE